jgi:hypothetical protein
VTAAARAELQAAAQQAAKAAADCRQTAEQMRAARDTCERFVARLATTVHAQQRHA